jgi:hypothetical protein
VPLRFIFRADKVTVQNVSDRVVMLSLVGPNSRQLLAQLSVGDVLDAPYASHSLLNFKDSPVVVAAGGGLPVPGARGGVSPPTGGVRVPGRSSTLR